jgi:hypothetical protein
MHRIRAAMRRARTPDLPPPSSLRRYDPEGLVAEILKNHPAATRDEVIAMLRAHGGI